MNHTVKCLLLPLRGTALLLPASWVQEIIPAMPLQPGDIGGDGEDDWHLGWVSIRGKKVMVIGIEPLLGAPLPDLALQQRLALLHDIDNASVLALRLDALPQVRIIGPADMTPLSDVDEEQMRWGQWVYHQGERVLIPDMKALSLLVGEALSLSSMV